MQNQYKNKLNFKNIFLYFTPVNAYIGPPQFMETWIRPLNFPTRYVTTTSDGNEINLGNDDVGY